MVPLSTLAWKVINDLPRLGPYVFCIDGRRPIVNFHRIKDKLDAKLKFREPFVLHDLRQVVRERSAEIGHPSGGDRGGARTQQRQPRGHRRALPAA